MTDRMDTETLQALVGDLRQYHFDKEADVMEALAAEVLELRADHETAVRQVELAAEQMKGLVAELAAEKALSDDLDGGLKLAQDTIEAASKLLTKKSGTKWGLWYLYRISELRADHRKARGL